MSAFSWLGGLLLQLREGCSQMARLRTKHDDSRPVTPDRDLVGKGIYTIPEAGRLLAFALDESKKWNKIRRWTQGYRYRYIHEYRESEPLVSPQVRISEDVDVVTFLELVELLVLAAFRKKGLSVATIRRIRQAALEKYGGPYPFARRDFNLLGKHVFADLKASDIGSAAKNRKFSEEVINGQLAFDELVRPLFERCLDFSPDTDLALHYWPLGQDKAVVIDPERSFGRPIIAAKGTPTAVIYAMVKAGDSEQDIAGWYGLDLEAVKDAIEFESRFSGNKAA